MQFNRLKDPEILGAAKITNRKIISIIFLAMSIIFVLSDIVFAENWPCWRGPRGDGTSNEKNVPVKWSSKQNIVWKTPIPGKGHASPIVWQKYVFVVTAVKEQKQRKLLCLDRKDGSILWQKVILEAPLERINRLNSYASSTPATEEPKTPLKEG